MAKPSFNQEFAATVLLEAVYTTDALVCEKYGIAPRTLRGYRQRFAEDEKFAAFCHTKKKIIDEKWAEVLPATLRKTLTFLERASEQAAKDPEAYQNPQLIEAFAGAAKLCADIYYTGKIIDARIADANRPPDQLPEQGDTAEASQYKM